MCHLYVIVLYLTLIAPSMSRYVCVAKDEVQDQTNTINSNENDPIYFTTDEFTTTEDTMRMDVDFQKAVLPVETSTLDQHTTVTMITEKPTTEGKPFEIDIKVVIDAPLITCPENQKRDAKGDCRIIFGSINSFKRKSKESDMNM